MAFFKANNKYNASLTSDYTAGDSTLAVNTVPVNVPTIITVARGTSDETRFIVTGTSSGLLTGVTRLDGANEDISSGVAVECMIDEDFINQLESAVYNQSGLKGLTYAADGGSTDAYVITLAVAPTSLSDITGLPISFKANTANTGAATLAVNGLTAKTIKKQGNVDLDTGDILANQVVQVVYDGTNFQFLSATPLPAGITTGSNTQTLTNKRITKRVVAIVSSATPTPNADITDSYHITALTDNATFGAPTGTPTDGQVLVIRVKDDGSSQTLTFNSGTGGYRAGTDIPLPTGTVISKTMYMVFVYNAADTKWDLTGVIDNI